MKAIIPVAGVGTMLRPLTYTQPKPLIPVAGKPIVSFIIDELTKHGVTDLIFVVGYLGEKVRSFVEKNYGHLNVDFVYQAERQGLGHAIWKCKELVSEDEELLIFLGDTIIIADLDIFLDCPHSALAVKKVTDPTKFGVVEIDKEGFVTKAIEKPNIPKSNSAIVGLYKIKETKKLFDALTFMIDNEIKTHGEYQLTDALMRMINDGVKFTTFEVKNWFDCGKREILLETNATLLDRGDYPTENVDQFEATIIIPPVSIGKDCVVRNSIIGPHVTIGSNSTITSSIIKASIIGNYSTLEEVTLRDSVVGNDASIKGMSQSLNIGDNTEIDLS
jgi:glucose-1-phosphate thymidylyltransferase